MQDKGTLARKLSGPPKIPHREKSLEEEIAELEKQIEVEKENLIRLKRLRRAEEKRERKKKCECLIGPSWRSRPG